MKAFAALYRALDAATAIKRKQQALGDYLRAAMDDPTEHASAAWAVYFLAGGKPRQLAPTKLLRRLAQEEAELPEWLFDECYHAVGDLAETLALLLPLGGAIEEVSLDAWMRVRLLPLRLLPEEEKYAQLCEWTRALPQPQRLVFFKLITGELRVGVSRLQVTQALALAAGVDQTRMAQRMMGYTQAGRAPTATDFAALTAPASADEDAALKEGQPYPFYLAHPFQRPVEEMAEVLGPVDDWIVEWKFDGVRAQYVQRGGRFALWSRGEELVTDSYPELAELSRWLPDGVALDGELVVMRTEGAASPQDLAGLRPFALLQQRLGRKVVTAKILRELPVAFIAYDLLEQDSADLRPSPQIERRRLLETFIAGALSRACDFGVALPLRLSPLLTAPDWPSLYARREDARALGVEGMILKARAGAYGVGRRKGSDRDNVWWKWKLDPMSVDAVLIYAQRGHGRRSGVYSDYTFAVWSDSPEARERMLIPFAKAYSGLTDEEMRAVDAIIRKTTVETFGPVRSVKPTLVFELGFEGIAESKRHRSGVAVRFPRMLRWRLDKPVEEADTLQTLRELLPAQHA
ncbi:ATP-dependent DNA ligase [Methylocystis echinoides]|uniref:ATP-dependent DNA ligase n=1 Tax=Methylocystis echinoides TaxID=29468 RepID=UPI00342A43F9